MRLFLLGYMGSGKSSVGQQLAEELGYDFYDLDSIFEDKFQSSIPDFFIKYGESQFRENESDVLKSLEIKEDAVVSTGGGLPCHHDNLDYINQIGSSLYLYVKNKNLSHRLYNSDISKRPLLKDIHTEEKMMKFVSDSIQEREPYYFKTHLIIDANQSQEDIIIDIKKSFAF